MILAEIVRSLLARRSLAVILVGISALSVTFPVVVASNELSALSARDRAGSLDGWYVVRASAATGDAFAPVWVQVLSSIDGADWVAGVSPAVDARIPGSGAVVPVRQVVLSDPSAVGIPESGGLGRVAHQRRDGPAFGAASPLSVPWSTEGLQLSLNDAIAWDAISTEVGEAVVLADPSRPELRVRTLLVAARDLEEAERIARVLPEVLAGNQSDQILVAPSASLFQAERQLQMGLEREARIRISWLLVGVAAVASLAQLVSVRLRLREFARRRALGASRRLLVSIVEGEVFIASTGGALVGAAAGLGIALRGGGTVPIAECAVMVCMASATSLLFAFPVALWAARSDPVRVLRVP